MSDKVEEMKSPKVLYIMGTGRSGSTILEILLSHGEHCFGAGELSLLAQDGFIENKPCSCGASFKDCPFWSRINSRLNLSDAEITEWARVQRKVDWHTGLLRRLTRTLSIREIAEYNKYNVMLLEAIREESGAKIIIDSSKYAARALALSECGGIETFAVCLTRSPEGLVNSFQKKNKEEQPPKSPWAVVRYYLFIMTSLCIVSPRLRRNVFHVTYEEFLSDPATMLSKISERCDIDLKGVIERIKNQGEFPVGHLITANRLRTNKTIKLERTLNNSTKQFRNTKFPLAFMHAFQRLIGDRLSDRKE